MQDSVFLKRVSGNSMFPTLRNGDKILVKKTTISSLRLLDIILFKKDSQDISHRITGIKKGIFYTKGDFVFKGGEKINKDNIIGKVIGVYRKDRLKSLRPEHTFLYYIFVNILSLAKDTLLLIIEGLYSLYFIRKMLNFLFPLKAEYIVVSIQRDNQLFEGFYNVFPFDVSSYVILYRLLAVLGKKPVGKIWVLKNTATGNILLYGPYIKLLYRVRGIGRGLIKKTLKIVDKESKDINMFFSQHDKRLLRFYKNLGLNKFLFSKPR